MVKIMENEHRGHRARMKKRYLSTGFDSFEPHEILEVILYYCYPQKDTNPVAHKLLDSFGSISAVFDAPFDTLVKAGLSEHAAAYIKMLPDVSRVYLDDRNNNRSKIINLNRLESYFINKFVGRVEEHFILLLLDSKCKELFCGVISSGTNTNSDVNVRKIVDLAMRYNAVIAAVAHNHPSGIALPSSTDIRTTVSLSKTLSCVGVTLYDHVVVADDDAISMRNSALCDEAFF